MEYTIRPLREDEYPLLRNFLYEAIFIPEGTEPPPLSIIDLPELQVYISDFGSERSDICFVAEVVGEVSGRVVGEVSVAVSAETADAIAGAAGGAAGAEVSGEVCAVAADSVAGVARNAVGTEAFGRIVGAVWVRIMNDYGHIADDVPSFAISLYKDYRGMGIGTALMTKMLAELRERGFKKASLAVQKANFAVKLYENVGFKIIDENAEEYIMVCNLG